ncbi:sodium:solute symporter [Cryomorpha ignava]|uniref:Sodium:solute symporter n=1 Tax=Cryomorpha ignava TaxID=101383 RepID=A0A7K3WNI6_9FLAO|nr:sodium:solute symporter [Cryomorpha ignava]NEN23217.1 sodium:solute symporter [Cryomorpha ignava]
MSPVAIIALIAAYFLALILIARITSRKSDNNSFFVGNRKSPWYIVAFGMIGASLSGVTFISVPGWVGASQFSYMQMVLGYVPGYIVIAFVLLPLYYRLQLTSIYTYLNGRFGRKSYKTGASFFLLSRIIGASFRLYLVAIVLQFAVFDRLGMEVPFVVTVLITIALIWLYTFRGGIKTIIWTDTLQTAFMLLAVGISVYAISNALGLDANGLIETVKNSEYSQIFFFDDPNDPRFFFKQFFAGMFITITMTGLDQDMMQKNLSCKNLRDAQKNMLSFTIVLVFVNLVFMTMGALLYIFAGAKGIELPAKADELYPMLAVDGYLGASVGILFVLGLIAAAYSSADSALTALTTSFSIDILEVEKKAENIAKRIRQRVHIGMSIVLVFVIMLFRIINNDSVISQLFTAAGYTYGPLLGLYAFGLFSKRQVRDNDVPYIAIASPIISFVLDYWSADIFGGYEIGFEILIINGAITYLGLFISSILKKDAPSS